MKIPKLKTPKFTLRELRLIPYHSIEASVSQNQELQRLNPLQLQFPFKRLLDLDQFLVSPDANVAITFSAGEGCKRHLDLTPHREYFIIGDDVYERITIRDIGKRMAKGLSKIINGRLTYWVILVKPSNHADLTNAIKTYVQRII